MQTEILEKATEMFLTLGFKSVTMDDIANEMGISKKTIYQHFATKPELVKSVTVRLFETISCGIDGICNTGKNPIEELFEVKNFVLQHLKDENSSPIYQLQKYYPKIHNTLKQMQFEKMDDCVIDNLNRGITEGLYRKEINTEIIGRLYFAGMNSIKDGELFPANQFSLKNVQNQYLEYHLRGICTLKGIQILESLIQ
ncbi:TetR/AcrR family transcriptional regulator [Flavobacterium sp. NRK F10]|uniref:TetR/AcrR family transcriptional regulator n=1 Tax=Flavobacterium sp. NRK F10 TaxID=2954931 RepID=UPI002090DAF4|nr:TetR/AcrR family transcriptional regulator [Flavobacterium sp. NRK F10]MCO6174918.1 TetR/AcrR family transcriptional regulator [Flavobacterium sp. NRK F10]